MLGPEPPQQAWHGAAGGTAGHWLLLAVSAAAGPGGSIPAIQSAWQDAPASPPVPWWHGLYHPATGAAWPPALPQHGPTEPLQCWEGEQLDSC